MKTRRNIMAILLLALTVSIQAGIGEGQSQVGPVPVELISFSVSLNGNLVLLNWTTATEINNYGFNVERRTGVGEWEKIGFVEGHGNSNSPREYSFVDTETPHSISSISYRLKQIDTDGKFEYSHIIALKSNLLKEYVLKQNYPNPFNPSTVISYSIPTESHVSLKIFDVLGNTIATLVNKNQKVGSYKVNFIANDLSNGIYIYKISAGEFVSVKKMILVK